MDHHRSLLLAVGSDVRQIETIRHGIVELAGAELPRATDRVFHLKVDLRAVEGTIAFMDGKADRPALESRNECSFSGRPHLVGADRLLGPSRDLDLHVLETEDIVDAENPLDDADDFFFDLVFGTKDVGIVLAEAAHPRQT